MAVSFDRIAAAFRVNGRFRPKPQPVRGNGGCGAWARIAIDATERRLWGREQSPKQIPSVRFSTISFILRQFARAMPPGGRFAGRLRYQARRDRIGPGCEPSGRHRPLRGDLAPGRPSYSPITIVLGYDVVGEIDQLGDGVSGFSLATVWSI
jgi:hypothetical protein